MDVAAKMTQIEPRKRKVQRLNCNTGTASILARALGRSSSLKLNQRRPGEIVQIREKITRNKQVYTDKISINKNKIHERERERVERSYGMRVAERSIRTLRIRKPNPS
ncbi:hypothetical protein CsSME_00019587 [Camellia sinensis var. sinensis]